MNYFKMYRTYIIETDKTAEHMVKNQEELCTKLNELVQKCCTSGKRIRLKMRSCLWKDSLAKLERVNPSCLDGILTVQFIGKP